MQINLWQYCCAGTLLMQCSMLGAVTVLESFPSAEG